MSETGLVTIAFSKAMRFPKNWVSKYMKDSRINEIEDAMIDTIDVPFLKFWYE